MLSVLCSVFIGERKRGMEGKKGREKKEKKERNRKEEEYKE